MVLDTRYINSLIDESKGHWRIEPKQLKLSKLNGHYYTTADVNNAYNQLSLKEQSHRLTKFVIGNQQNQFTRLFYGRSIGPAALSAFLWENSRPLILSKNIITK